MREGEGEERYERGPLMAMTSLAVRLSQFLLWSLPQKNGKILPFSTFFLLAAQKTCRKRKLRRSRVGSLDREQISAI